MMSKGKNKPAQTKSHSLPGRSRLAPALSPWVAVVAGIDQGKVSGFSCWIRGEYCLSTTVKSAKIRRDCVQYAWTRAVGKGLPLIFVLEKHNPYTPKKDKHGKQVMMSYKTLFGMGESRGKWIQVIDELPGLWVYIVEIPTMAWKRAHGIKGPRKNAKKAAILKANSLIRNKTDVKITDDNEAEAVLIGQVGCYSDLCAKEGLERVEK